MIKTSLSLAAFVLLAGCVTAPPAPPHVGAGASEAGQAVVIVYRPNTLDHFARKPTVKIGSTACDLAMGASFRHAVPPGRVAVTTDLWDWPGTSKAEFLAEAGQTYRVRILPNPDKRLAGLLGGHPGVWVAEAFADRPGPFLVDLVHG